MDSGSTSCPERTPSLFWLTLSAMAASAIKRRLSHFVDTGFILLLYVLMNDGTTISLGIEKDNQLLPICDKEMTAIVYFHKYRAITFVETF